MNCATGPADMREHVRTLSRSSRLPIMVMPNAGIPELVDGETCYPLSPQGLADAHEEFVRDFGVNIVGGCCGSTPEPPRYLLARVEGLVPRVRVLDAPRLVRPEYRELTRPRGAPFVGIDPRNVPAADGDDREDSPPAAADTASLQRAGWSSTGRASPRYTRRSRSSRTPRSW